MTKIVVSLTTIKSRVPNLNKVLDSILKGTKLPDIINIFYSDTQNIYDEGCTQNDIKHIYEYIDKNITSVKIILSKVDNIGPYRKIIDSLKIYNNDIIITIDDDEIFEPNLVEKFIEAYTEYNCIICSIGRIVDITNWQNMKDTTDYYKRILKTNIPYMNILPEGYGAILYHSKMFNFDFVNFNYSELDNINELLSKNDDIFLRFYTYNMDIPVHVVPIYQKNIYNVTKIKTLFGANKDIPINTLFGYAYMAQKVFIKKKLSHDNLNDIQNLMTVFKAIENQNILKTIVHTNTDIKKIQYKINNNKQDHFDINQTIQDIFFNKERTDNNTLLINIESDVLRYESSIQEYKKILITDFVHLKATYWKNKQKFRDDINKILIFMSQFNTQIKSQEVDINIFSEFSDKNIHISDGPLACYCSHIRSIIYGYLNFSNYTIITEDDFHINDTKSILENLKKIPNDWDIICCGAAPINTFYEGDFYKFSDMFHSTHFYIIRNSSMKTIFENIYPIYDQVDILLSKLHNKLNIYNIPNCVGQKNFESNTQNNLFVIYNSPNYEYIRTTIRTLKLLLKNLIYEKFKINTSSEYDKHIDNIVLKILFDVVLSKISTLNKIVEKNDNNDNNESSVEKIYENYFITNFREKISFQIQIIIDSCVKGININTITQCTVNDIYSIVDDFKLVNTIDDYTKQIYFPLNYGSTSNVYLLGTDNKMIVKVYNKKFRWTYIDHENKDSVMDKEIKFLERLSKYDVFQKLVKYDDSRIYMEYVGESMFDNFSLPENWIEQLTNIFEILTKNNICYSEFNLKNITCHTNKLYLIDYGLAKDLDSLDNSNNLKNFVEILDLINEKFKVIKDIEQQHVYYINLINNIKLTKDHKYSLNFY